MRLTSFLILSIIISGCATMPKPDPIPRCALIARAGGSAPYLYCKMFDGSKESGTAWRVPIDDLLDPAAHPEKYICTTDSGYSYLEGVYKPQLDRYITKHCK